MAPKALSDREKTYLDGEIIRLILRRRKIRQTEAAKRLRVSDSSLYQYLQSTYPVDSIFLAGLCKLLKITDHSHIIIPRPESANA